MKKTYQEPSVEMMQFNPMTIVMGSPLGLGGDDVPDGEPGD